MEWDNYEWSWVGSLTGWALCSPGHPDAAEALAREHRDGWLRGYRNVLGVRHARTPQLTDRHRGCTPPTVPSANTVSIAFTASTQRYWRLNFTANTGRPAGQCSEFQIWTS